MACRTAGASIKESAFFIYDGHNGCVGVIDDTQEPLGKQPLIIGVIGLGIRAFLPKQYLFLKKVPACSSQNGFFEAIPAFE
jgi:hypothetical protein